MYIEKTGDIKSYKDLIAYKKALDLAVRVCALTRTFSREEIHSIGSQMSRAALSVPSNIAEGFRRRSVKEYLNFLSYAHGSCSELETQLVVSHETGLIGEEQFQCLQDLQSDVSKLLLRLIQTLNKKTG